MSVFRIKLNNAVQGNLDFDPSTASPGNLGTQMDPSIQRGVWVSGPGRINRLLLDDGTFSDCNYWKRFAYPQVPLSEAFIEVITDDGSVYSDIPSENTFAVTRSYTGSATDTLDFVGTYGSPAVFVQIDNTGAAAITVELNGDATATFTMAAGDTQVFDNGDLVITKLVITHTDTVQVIASVRSVCNS